MRSFTEESITDPLETVKRVLFIQNGEHDGPGLFGTVLEENGVALDTLHAWRGESVPPSPGDWSGVAVGGGSMSASETEDYPFLAETTLLIKNSRSAAVPVIGMCLGAQLMAGAFGGGVFPNRSKEIGFFDIRFTEAAKTDALWSSNTAPFRPLHWHRDTFKLPSHAVLLASSDLTQNQLFRVDGIHYGLQFHLEIGTALLDEMITAGDCGLPENGVDPVEFFEQAKTALPKVEPVAHEVFGRWTRLLA